MGGKHQACSERLRDIYCPDELIPTRLRERGCGRSGFIKTSRPAARSVVKSRGLSVRASQSLLGALTESATDLKTAPASKGLFVNSNGAHVLPLKSSSECNKWIPRQRFHSSQQSRCTVEYYTAIHQEKKIVFISTGTCLAVLVLSLSWRCLGR